MCSAIGNNPRGCHSRISAISKMFDPKRHFRRQEADIVAGQSDQDGADEAAADRTQAADDENDENQNRHAVADLAADDRLVLPPHHAAHAGERGAGHEHADEHAAD